MKYGVFCPTCSCRSFLTITAASLGDEGAYACFAAGEASGTGGSALWQEVRLRLDPVSIVALRACSAFDTCCCSGCCLSLVD